MSKRKSDAEKQPKKMGGPRKYKTCKCGFIGYGAKSFPHHAKGLCKPCWQLVLKEKKERSVQMLNRPCKSCGIAINTTDKNKSFCCHKCAMDFVKNKRVKRKCVTCGKEVARAPSLAKNYKEFACSLECQRQFSLIKNRGKPKRNDVRRSLLAKAKWKKHHSQSRRENSVYAKWIDKAARFISNQNCKKDRWKARCFSAASSLEKRSLNHPGDPFKLSCISWELATKSQMQSIGLEEKDAKKSKWSNKCSSVARNIKMRLTN